MISYNKTNHLKFETVRVYENFVFIVVWLVIVKFFDIFSKTVRPNPSFHHSGPNSVTITVVLSCGDEYTVNTVHLDRPFHLL